MRLLVDEEGMVVNVILAGDSFDPGPGFRVVPPNPAEATVGWQIDQHGVAWPPPSPPDESFSIEEARRRKHAEINDAFESAASALTEGYPETERLTWTVQLQEAIAWGADSLVATPYLDGLASERGISVGEMRTKTLEQVRQFLAASQVLVGKRQRLRDAVNAVQDGPNAMNELAAIAWG
ncbi:hypothetical protein [Achromobacter xylosoxidans]|uniref:hypothetical protein n=1 Tax=Alcaligenes xylosoxydans xylosoxydans TaxID=85698 RepID=UPI001F07095C|nr:hypothetical protein [Achromobacter xylosoxidans]MCH1989146.1 hypothetical protein [Achromobacter xylosoxidans]MCH4589475.1 hypothetical protein [Achromobacter xylosoxidans]